MSVGDTVIYSVARNPNPYRGKVKSIAKTNMTLEGGVHQFYGALPDFKQSVSSVTHIMKKSKKGQTVLAVDGNKFSHYIKTSARKRITKKG